MFQQMFVRHYSFVSTTARALQASTSGKPWGRFKGAAKRQTVHVTFIPPRQARHRRRRVQQPGNGLNCQLRLVSLVTVTHLQFSMIVFQSCLSKAETWPEENVQGVLSEGTRNRGNHGHSRTADLGVLFVQGTPTKPLIPPNFSKPRRCSAGTSVRLHPTTLHRRRFFSARPVALVLR